MSNGDYRKLSVWHKAMDLVQLVYKLTDTFPADERYGLVSQMRRAAISIPSNIAEGRRRGGEKEFRQFLSIAYGSGAELETQIEIAGRLGYVNKQLLSQSVDATDHVMRMINNLLAV